MARHIRIYPNPAREMATIEVNDLYGPVNGTILTSLGQAMKEFILKAEPGETVSYQLDLSNIPRGVYLVRFSNPAFTHIQKLVTE